VATDAVVDLRSHDHTEDWVINCGTKSYLRIKLTVSLKIGDLYKLFGASLLCIVIFKEETEQERE